MQVACGFRHTLILADYCVYGFGNNTFGQTGHSQQLKVVARPKKIRHLSKLKCMDIAAGMQHSAAISADGQLFTWGYDGHNQLGRAGAPYIPKRVMGKLKNSFISKVDCGNAHTLALTREGKLYSWGRGQEGQLGAGYGFVDYVSPRLIPKLSDVKIIHIAVGANHNLALSDKDKIYAWGENGDGQTGLEKKIGDVDEPMLIESMQRKRIVKIFAGYSHSGAISKSGLLYIWGSNEYGQLGNGTREPRCLKPKILEGIMFSQPIVDCSGGFRHTLVATDLGDVYSWGWNKFGNLGLGKGKRGVEAKRSPSLVIKGSNIETVVAGGEHSIAVPTVVDHIPGLGKRLSKMIDHKPTSDISFKIGDKTLYAHKAIIWARCKEFYEICDKEKSTYHVKVDIYKVFDVPSYLLLRAFLEYLYTDYVVLSNYVGAAESLLDLSLKYKLVRLNTIISNFKKQGRHSISMSPFISHHQMNFGLKDKEMIFSEEESEGSFIIENEFSDEGFVCTEDAVEENEEWGEVIEEGPGGEMEEEREEGGEVICEEEEEEEGGMVEEEGEVIGEEEEAFEEEYEFEDSEEEEVIEVLALPPSTLAEDLRKLVALEDFSDVSFLFSNTFTNSVDIVPAHACVLLASAPAIQPLLGMGQEANVPTKLRSTLGTSLSERANAADVIMLESIAFYEMKVVLEYLYCDDTSNLTPDLSLSLLRCCKLLKLPKHFFRLVECAAIKVLNLRNLSYVIQVARESNAKFLRRACYDLAIKNYRVVRVDMNSEGLTQSDIHNIHGIMRRRGLDIPVIKKKAEDEDSDDAIDIAATISTFFSENTPLDLSSLMSSFKF
eukprot:CAMPEP_0174276782 /NCGR_PEP_ID=MMETSP0439-20130205/60577_1 /TAXON_ID=0 /ORGANISM="Stereomyxa ramosa, Strain Chinc5" /LENGTH=831 /DNA_ID=CAMNT_0015369049 /DNA_START=140 /DNA_END=2635 /DNA_ORIENTATION=-